MFYILSDENVHFVFNDVCPITFNKRRAVTRAAFCKRLQCGVFAENKSDRKNSIFRYTRCFIFISIPRVPFTECIRFRIRMLSQQYSETLALTLRDDVTREFNATSSLSPCVNPATLFELHSALWRVINNNGKLHRYLELLTFHQFPIYIFIVITNTFIVAPISLVITHTFGVALYYITNIRSETKYITSNNVVSRAKKKRLSVYSRRSCSRTRARARSEKLTSCSGSLTADCREILVDVCPT